MGSEQGAEVGVVTPLRLWWWLWRVLGDEMRQGPFDGQGFGEIYLTIDWEVGRERDRG
jgi:hypothetical protein